MGNYGECRTVEVKGMEALLPYAREKCGGDVWWVPLTHQYRGDLLLPSDLWIECKTEERHTGNLFLETWSNRPFKEGWIKTSKADRLWYYFLSSECMYHCDMRVIQQWWRDKGGKDGVEQKANEQRNSTWGFIAKILELKKDGIINQEPLQLCRKLDLKHMYLPQS